MSIWDRLRRGLPYGWWESRSFWDVVLLLIMSGMFALVIIAYFAGWEPPAFP